MSQLPKLISRRLPLLAAFVCAMALFVCAQNAPEAFLPKKFAGYVKKSSNAGVNGKASAALPANGLIAFFEAGCFAPLISEWGITSAEGAEYSGGVSVTMLRFRDASGAMAAFTNFRAQKLGVAGGVTSCLEVGRDKRIAHIRDFVVIASPSLPEKDLDTLMQSLPEVYGPAAQAPQILQYLPAKGVDAAAARYVVGPVGYKDLGLPIAPELIHFDYSPELLVAPTSDHKAQLVILSYPTPQMAIQRVKLIEEQRKTPEQQAALHVKRDGPIVTMLVGAADEAAAQALFAQIHYEAEVTDNEKAHPARTDNIGYIVVRASMLGGYIFLLTVVPGVLLGFRMEILGLIFPRWAAKRREEKEFTGLKLR